MAFWPPFVYSYLCSLVNADIPELAATLGEVWGKSNTQRSSTIFKSHFPSFSVHLSPLNLSPLFQSSDKFYPDSFPLVFQYFRYFSKEMRAWTCLPCHIADVALWIIFKTLSLLDGVPGKQIQTQRTAHRKFINVHSCVNTRAGKRSCRTGYKGSLERIATWMNKGNFEAEVAHLSYLDIRWEGRACIPLYGAVGRCPLPIQLSSEDSNAQGELMSDLSARRAPYHLVNKGLIPEVGSGHVLQCQPLPTPWAARIYFSFWSLGAARLCYTSLPRAT